MKKCYQCRKEKEEFFTRNGKVYGICKDCRTSLYCNHDKEKRKCKICKGSQICEHKKDEEEWKMLIHGCRQTMMV